MSNKGETAEDQFQGTISKFPPPPKKTKPLLVYVLHKTQKIRHFHVLVVKKRQRNVQKNCDTRTKLLSCLWNLSLPDILVAVASLDLKDPLRSNDATAGRERQRQ